MSRAGLVLLVGALCLLSTAPADAYINRVVDAAGQANVRYDLTDRGNFDFTEFTANGIGDLNHDGLDDVGVDLGNRQPPLDGVFVVPGRRKGGRVIIDSPRGSAFRLRGTVGSYASGEPTVKPAGDFNGDGIDDLVTLGYDSAERSSLATVVFGQGSDHPADVDVARPGGRGLRIVGAVGSVGVSGADDVNGDGLDDVIVVADPRRAPGYAAVVFGGPEAGTVDLGQLESRGFRLENHCTTHRSVDVAGVDDFNGDGLADVLLGTGTGSSSVCREAGDQAVLVYGKRSSDPIDLERLGGQGARVVGRHVGGRVSGGGDFDGDGRPDLVVGTSKGAFVIHRLAAGVSTPVQQLRAAATRVRGNVVEPRVEVLGDTNGDGKTDIAIDDRVIFGRRSHDRISFDLPGRGGYRVLDTDSAAAGYIPGGLAAAGDVNGDGSADILTLPVEYAEGPGTLLWGRGPPIVRASPFKSRVEVDQRGRMRVGLLCPATTVHLCRGSVNVRSRGGRRLLYRRIKLGAGRPGAVYGPLPGALRRRVDLGILVGVRVAIAAKNGLGRRARTTQTLFLQVRSRR